MKRITYLLLLLTLAVGFSSCDDEYYNQPYWGSWGMVAYGENGYERDIYNSEYEEYIFYEDWTGYYSNNTGVRTQFNYTDYGNGHLYLRHSDGLVEDIYYYFDNGYMIMSASRDFYAYRVYDRRRF